MYQKTEFYFPSVSGMATIHAAKYLPENGKVKAVFQISHGMAEHFERYEKFIDELCKNGIAVYTNDHLGHGKSVATDDDLGYFGEAGWEAMREDCKQVLDIAKKEQPNKPYFFFGHSMGSFVCRTFISKYGSELNGAIVCGTGGSNPALSIGIALAKLVAKCKGDRHHSTFVNTLAFGSYNKNFEGRTEYDWLTRDNDVVDEYIADRYSGYLFTVNGLLNLFKILQYANSKKCYKGIPKNLPILLIAGADDPVGNYGKGVHEVSDKMSAAGIEDVNLILYENCRHEILNESQAFATVCEDIINFIKTNK